MDFGQETKAMARKDHLCQICDTIIAKGTVYARYKGKWESEWQNWAAHAPCMLMYMEQISPDPTPCGDFNLIDILSTAEKTDVLDLFLEYYPIDPLDDNGSEYEKRKISRYLQLARERAARRAAEAHSEHVGVG